MEEKKYDLIAFTDKGLSLDVRVDPDDDTVWLTKDQMALLFDRDRSVISRHIKSIYKDGELSEKSTCAFFARVPSTRKRSYESIMYNLDVIISVGYRVKSGRGILFRKWASSILKQYLLKGYAVDGKRLSAHEKSLAELSGKVLSLDARTHANEERVKALEEAASRELWRHTRRLVRSPYSSPPTIFSLSICRISTHHKESNRILAPSMTK